MIKADALTRKYGEFTAVDSVSFEIGAGEIVGLLGHNGAGKTTIMKMMTGFLEPSAGTVYINGTDVWQHRNSVQAQIGYLPENCPLYPEMTVVNYLDYAAGLRGVSDERRFDRIGYVIEKTSLIKVAQKPICTLSRGYKQRLGVAQAILNSPSILILDEPTNGLDPSQILEMRSLIRELAQSATVVVSTHILQEVQAVCDRVVIINGGRVALDSRLCDLQNTGKLKLATDAPPEKCLPLLSKIDGVEPAQSAREDGHYVYVIEADRQLLAQTSARAARLLIESGYNIYVMQPVTRDLETIFGEITAGGGPGPDGQELLKQVAQAVAPNTVPAEQEVKQEVLAAGQQDGVSHE